MEETGRLLSNTWLELGKKWLPEKETVLLEERPPKYALNCNYRYTMFSKQNKVNSDIFYFNVYMHTVLGVVEQ